MQRSQEKNSKNSTLLKNELFIYDLCIAVIEIVKNQESPPNGTRSKYDCHLNIWAILQKPSLRICLYVLLPDVLPFLILPGKPIPPVCYFNSFNTHVCEAGGTRLTHGTNLWEFNEIQGCGSQTISENRKEAGKFMEECPNRTKNQKTVYAACSL